MFTHRSLLHTFSIVVIFTLLFSGFSLPVAAQEEDGLTRQINPQTGKVSFLRPENGEVFSAYQALGTSARPQDPAMALAKRFAPEFGLKDPEQELKAAKTDYAKDGRITAHYQQQYQGIPVLGGELIVNTNENGDFYSMNGEISSILSLSTQPTIDSEQAKQTALQATAKWYEKKTADFVASEPELWIFDESLLLPSTRPAELVWRMEVMPNDIGMPVRELVLVNAQRGNISLHFNQVDTAWSASGDSGTSQDPTPTPMPTETPLPTETPEPVATEVSIAEELSNGESSASRTFTAQGTAATGALWYVTTSGSDSNSCSVPASPCGTISGAIGKAADGDTIQIAEGTYTGTGFYVVSIGKSLLLSGGWDNTFGVQKGFSTLDGQNVRPVFSAGGIGPGVTIDHFIITNGYASFGGGGISSSGTLTVNNSIVMNNKGEASTGTAGGIYVDRGSLTLNNTTVRGNFAAYRGGGITVSGEPALTINNSTIAENQAIDYGGGIVFSGGSGGVVQVTTITNSTIVNNTATAIGGVNIQGWSPGRVVTIKNSLIAKNSSKTNGPDCWGTINALEYSLLGVGNDCTVASGTGNLINIDPRISASPVGALGYYPLQAASPAIDKGANCLSTDQRGVSRPQGSACDIGAYEYTVPGPAAYLGIISGSNQHAGTSLPFSKPLAVYVVDALGSPVSGVNVTFTAPASGASGSFANSGTYSTTVTTNANGWATASTFNANSQNGTYNVTATISGLPSSVSFLLTNATWYVSSTGSNTNSCASPGVPCLTINGAISKASEGDAIKVASGTYTDTSSPVVNITKGLILSGGWNALFNSRAGKSIVDGGGAYTGISIGDFNKVTISNFIVRNSTDGIANNNGDLTFENGALTNNNNGLSNHGDARLTNITISGNRASTRAGSAIGNFAGTVQIQYSTITNNDGYYDTAITSSLNSAARIEIGNSILAKNGYRDCDGNLTSLGNNIFGSSPACIGSFTLQAGDKVGVDPKLFPLLPGGYHPVLPDSPAMNAANSATCPSTDQRDISRPVGAACDIGAFEYHGSGTIPAFIVVYTGAPQNIVLGAAASTPLRAAVFDDRGDVVPGATVTFTAPGNGASSIFASTNTNVATAITDANGIAVSPVFKANIVLGSYTVNATVAGGMAAANFQLTNIAQPVRTYTAHNSYLLPGLDLCTESNPNCTNGYNPLADKAHLYAMGTANFYLTQHNRGGMDHHGMTIVSSVDYCPNDVRLPCPYTNAFWNGQQMVYGSAYGFALADDVVAHELTHGFTQYESNLFPYYQSGAIGESFSDLWGEYYDQANGLGNDAVGMRWLIGEDVSGLSPVRNMSNPPAYGDPDKMSSANYRKDNADSGGIHHNSGVNNKAVYLMVDGGTFNGKAVTALGWDKASAIYYEANTNLLSSGADYSDLYYALQQACSNLVGQKGITSGDCAEVKDAIDAVEMYAQPAMNFNTEAPYCEASVPGTTIFADDLETGTGNWTFNNGSHVRWQIDSPDFGPYAQSGLHSLYADDYPAEVTDASAILKSFVVPSNAYLRFAQAYGFETGYKIGDPTLYNFDGGVLEYSLNNGSTWLDAGPLMDFNGYTGIVFSGYDIFHSNPLKGRSAFVGSSHGYISTRLNLAGLAGQTVSFRWRMGLDATYYDWGWWVDNVQAYTCPVILSRDTTGVFRPSNGLLYLKNSNTTGFADVAINYGVAGDYPVVGDWDGDGTATIGIYRNGKFYLRNSNTIGYADIVFPFGTPGDQPVAGDWDGDGKDTIGVYRPSTGQFLLRNSNSTGFAEMSFYLGNVGDVGIAGDWNGDGKDTTGVFRPINGIIFLKNTNETGYADIALNYGIPGDRPVTGDWDNDGIDTIGVYRNGRFLLRNSNTIGFADIAFGLGIPGDMPIAGDWDRLP